METHDRLMKVPTTGLTVLDILTDDDQENKSLILRDLLEVCNRKISNNCTDLKILEIFRMILCYEYQTFINSGIRWSSVELNEGKIDVNTFFLRDIDCFQNSQEFAFLYDIATLQLAFNCNEKALISSFSDFYETQKDYLGIEEKALRLCLGVLECIADSYNLHSRLHKRVEEKQEFEELPDCILRVIELWMKQETSVEWRILAKLLPKLVSIFGAQNVLTPLWNKVLDDRNELDKILGTLCVIADLCIPSKENLVEKMQFEYCVSPQFWSVLCRSIDSKIYQERKKGLYLIKRALDFISCHESEIKIHVDIEKVEMVPFIRTDLLTKENATNSLTKLFFLILESSEEKQKHLVLPALTYLPNLVRAYSVQKSQGYNFHKMWLQCLFKRILGHDNIAIKKLALQEILKADLDIYDISLIDFLADFLNNILLYDFDCTEETLPKTVLQLAEFFWRSEQSRVLLINSFVQAISKISWCPVTIYWILNALEMAANNGNIVHNVWTPEELRSVTKLVTLNISNHSSPLHDGSKSLIQKAFCKYVAPNSYWSDVELVANTINSIAKVTLHPVYDHVAKIIKASDAQLYVSEQCETLWPAQSSKSFGATIILFARSGLILSDKKNWLAEKSLHELFQSLSDVHRRLYTDKAAVLRVLQLASYLMESINAASVENVQIDQLDRLLSPHLQTFFRIVESFIEKSTIPEYEHTRVAKALIEYSVDHEFDNFRTFLHQCIDLVFNPKKLGKYHWLFALKTINVYDELLRFVLTYLPKSISTAKMRSLIVYFKEEILNDRSGDATQANDEFDRKIVSDCSHNLALFICNYLRYARDDARIEKGFWLRHLQLLIETGPEENIIVVAKTIIALVSRIDDRGEIEDINVILSIIRLACRQIFQSKKSKVFFDAITSLTELVVFSKFLMLGEVARKIAIEWVDQLMMEGQRVPVLKKTFVENIHRIEAKNALFFLQPLLNCLLHGEIPRHDQKIERAALCNVIRRDTLYRDMDSLIRGQAVIALVEFLDRKKNSESSFRKKILQEILLILNKHRNKRYFDNSHVHRLKHRAMQALLVSSRFLNDEEVRNLYHEMCDLLIAESNQPSVRLMQEWLIVKIYTKSIMDVSIWKLFETAMEKRPGSIVSIASIVYHISRVLEGEIQIKFICKGISHLLPNCMSQQFNVRLYSQVILLKLYEMLPTSRCDQYKYIADGVRESLRHGNSIKNSPKIVDDFYFTEFHANAKDNLEMIYKELPRLTGVHSEEWIETGVFMSRILNETNFPIALECSSKWKSIKSKKPTPRSAGGELGNEQVDPTSEGGLGDIQKKIIPWKSMTPFTDELSEASKAALERKSKLDNDAGIIVVASLIDRPPNLGGLARTCEIFGAKELVIGSLKYAEDREFQTLSVSAEKWITITEVKAHLLTNYLLEQRSKGWKLVGAEQTANSTNLLEMEFDKKTILLLGNEKDGIPANLIPILDTCVEIPQHGVIRSLNVHVTGAICIWQYARQHVLA